MNINKLAYLLIPPALAALLLIGWGMLSGVARAAEVRLEGSHLTEQEPLQVDGSTGINSPAQCTPDTPDMVSYWPLDDGSGATVFVDQVGANDGTCTGMFCPSSVPGKVGAAFDFNGLHDRIVVADSETLNWAGDNSLSFELWVNTAQDCTGNKVFIGKYGESNASSWWVGCGAGGFVVFQLEDTDRVRKTITGTVPITDASWHHVVAVRNAAADLNTIYVDASLDVSAVVDYNGVFTNTSPLKLGEHNNSYFLDGVLDEVAVYTRALTLDEIEAHYNDGAGQSYCEGNVSPNVVNPGEQSNVEGDPVNLQVEAIDPDADPLVYQASGLPPDLDIDAGTGLISGIIADGADGGSPYTVMVTATDTGALSDVETFTWVVTSLNHAPDVTNPGDQNSAEGQSVNLQIDATDPDLGDSLTYNASSLPGTLTINPTSGLISGGIAAGAASGSPYTVVVTATDTGMLSDSETFTWTVEPQVVPPDEWILYLPTVVRND